MSTLKELLAQRAALDAQIQEQQTAERAHVVLEIKTLMSEYGITTQDLVATRTRSAASAPSPVKPKFRDPDTGETWSGRGLQPRWLKAKIDAGASLDSFRV